MKIVDYYYDTHNGERLPSLEFKLRIGNAGKARTTIEDIVLVSKFGKEVGGSHLDRVLEPGMTIEESVTFYDRKWSDSENSFKATMNGKIVIIVQHVLGEHRAELDLSEEFLLQH